jgi:hypothetical protein
MAKRGFGKENEGTDPLLVAERFFEHSPQFRFRTPEEVAEDRRQQEEKNRREGPQDSINLLMRNPAEGPLTRELTLGGEGLEEFNHKHKGMDAAANPLTHFVWGKGYWTVHVGQTVGMKSKEYDWQINAVITSGISHSPRVIREAIIKETDLETYEEWKRRQWSDIDSLRWCLNKACLFLGRNKGLGASYLTSPSSQRLVESLGVTTARGWAFLIPDQTF